MRNKNDHYLFCSDIRNEKNHQVLFWRATTLRASASLAFNLIILMFCFSIRLSNSWFVPMIEFFYFLYWFFLALISFHLPIHSSNSFLKVLFSSSNNAVLDRQCFSLPLNSVILSWNAFYCVWCRVSYSFVTWGEIGINSCTWSRN